MPYMQGMHEAVEQGLRFSGTIVTDNCESPCDGWELDLDPLEDLVV